MITKNNKKLLIIGIILVGTVIAGIFLFRNSTNKPSITGNSVTEDTGLNELKIKVAIPCPGHAGLIQGEVSKLNGVTNVEFNLPNKFTIKYIPNKISEEDILNLNIFTEYTATKI